MTTKRKDKATSGKLIDIFAVVSDRPSVPAIRAHLAKRPTCEDVHCPGWIISTSDKYGTQVERCDLCASGLSIFDEDVAKLPEARLALALSEVLDMLERMPTRWKEDPAIIPWVNSMKQLRDTRGGIPYGASDTSHMTPEEYAKHQAQFEVSHE